MASSTRKFLVPSIALIVAVSAASMGILWFEQHRFVESTDNAYVKADTIAIRPEVAGRIKAVPVHENQQVRKGDVLVQLDTSDFEAQLAQTNAETNVAQAALADIGEQILLQEKKVLAANANIDAAKAELQRARVELNRAATLARQDFGSKQLLENKQADTEVAKAHLDQAFAALAAEQQMLAVYHTKQDSAKAQIEAAHARARFASHQLSKATITAASDGVIGNLAAFAGGYAQPVQTLLQLVPIPQTYVIANFKETQIGRMSMGQHVKLTVDALPGITFTGKIDSLAPATGTEFSLLPQDNATGNFNKIVQRVPVKIQVIGPMEQVHLLRPGLSVLPEVDTSNFTEQLSYRSQTSTATPVATR
ncbi:Secretion protein HlyD [gamma proteobacterium HdN1]|nr:Secretion protein HlyD [gamma proteobacterium HdN1]